MRQELLYWITLGLSAGLLPGPMLGLVLRETLRHGRRAGYVVAAAPLLTDAPIIAVALLVVSSLPAQLGTWLAIGGGAFVIWLGIDALRTPPLTQPAPEAPLGSLRRALITNWLNPHPWLFWLPVGGPLLVSAWRDHGLAAASLNLSAFYVLLVGSKIILVEVVHRSSRFLSGKGYLWLIRGSGMLLIGLGLLLIFER